MAVAESAMSPWFATATLNAPEARYSLSALLEHSPTAPLAAEGGVVPAMVEPFALSSVGTASAPAWSVGIGQAVVQRPIGGAYVGTWDQPKTLAVDLPLPASGMSRYELVVCDIDDPEADSGDVAPRTVFRVRTVAGAPAASPTVPNVPAGTEPLWSYRVAANGALTELRTRRRFTRGIGGVRFVEPDDTRAGSHPADVRVFATGQIDLWLNVNGWRWITVVAPMAWTVEQASLQGAGPSAGEFGLGAGGSKIMRWKRVGNDLSITYAFRWGAQPWSSPGGNVTTYLPKGWVTPSDRDQWHPAQLWVNDPQSKVVLDFWGGALVQAGSNIVRPYFPRSNGSGGFATGIVPYRVATGQGPGNSIPFIAGGYAYGGTMHITMSNLELAA